MNRLCCTCNGAFVSSVRFIIVFTLTWAARETRGKPQERPLTTYIRHYEPLVFTQYEANPYDESMLHSRVRRSTHSNNVLRMDFTAHGRNFSLRMRPHSQLFHPNVKFESVADSGRTVIDFDPKQILTGYVQDASDSSCQGRMSDGVFDGVVHTQAETFFIEPARRYLPLYQSFDGVIFKSSDVLWDHPLHSKNKTSCAMNKWMYREMKKLQQTAQPVETSRKTTNHDQHSQSTKNMYRRAANAPLDTCTVLVAADRFFLQHVAGGSEAEAISEITLHVDAANTVYRTTEFGLTYRPGLSIARVQIYTDSSNIFDDPNLSVQNFLDRWSRLNHDYFCLAMLFTYRDFAGGVLGLAWVGYPSGSGTAGGVCQKQVRLSSGIRSLNSAIVSLINFGERVPRKVSLITTAHEFGHNFGSEHDPETAECSPGTSNNGNYIMYAKATDGDQPNNDELSPCSIRQIAAVLNSKAESCFQPTRGSFCGNGIKEKDEECDCGFSDECASVDPCCTPQGGQGNDTECTFRLDSNAECSPKDGGCCTQNCKILKPPFITPCKAATDCLQASYCNGSSGFCPEQLSIENQPAGGKLCDNGTKTCVLGDCSGSICSTINSTECFCDNSPYLCHICCRLPGTDQCLPTSSSELKGFNPDFRALLRSAGRSCQNYEGYCNSAGSCQGVDNNEVFNTLNKVLFSSDSLNWIKENWLVIVGIVGGIVFILIMLRVTYTKNKPVRNLARKAFSRKKKEAEEKLRKEKENAKRKKDTRMMLPRLKNMFPSAQEDLLKDVIHHSVNEEKAVEKLLAMKFLMRRW